MNVLLWVWSNLAFVGALAGLVALWWFHPRRMFTPISLAFTIALAAVLGGFGWGELRYSDGRDAGAVVERLKWEKSFEKLQSDKAKEKAEAEKALADAADEIRRLKGERDAARDDALTANARLFAEINADEPEPVTIQCEKANETVKCPVCRSCLRQRVDPRILRNLAISRGQK